jgi:hypothetical protein
VATAVGEPAEVTLRRPPPLGRPLRLEKRGDEAVLLAGAELVAEGRRAELELETPDPVSYETAADAVAGYTGFE